jgi:hypothetical protein
MLYNVQSTGNNFTMKPSKNLAISFVVLGFSLATVASPATTRECSASSGEHTVALLELYTSEGCSSCPPADRLLSSLPTRELGADHVVPLALHVDYWDYLGWRDPFAQNKFTKRQRRMGAINRLPTIYTPQFLLNGKDFRPWRAQSVNKQVADINRSKARAKLRINLKHDAAQLHITTDADVPDATDRQSADAYIVVYENKLTRNVKAGENAGRTLSHNFVAREFVGPIRLKSDGAKFEQTLVLAAEWKTKDLGVVAFVQDRRNGDVLQALALPVCQ